MTPLRSDSSRGNHKEFNKYENNWGIGAFFEKPQGLCTAQNLWVWALACFCQEKDLTF
jgi:hypothetical protein